MHMLVSLSKGFMGFYWWYMNGQGQMRIVGPNESCDQKWTWLMAVFGRPTLGAPSRPENHRTPTPSLRLFQNVCKPAEEAQRPPTLQEIKQKIASYNSREKNCLGMKLVSGPAHPRPPRAFRPPRPIPLAPCPLLVRSSAVPLHCGAAPIEVLSLGL